MAGSMDNEKVEVVNVTDETVLAVLVYPDGRCRINAANGDRQWVAETLRRIADQHDPGGNAPTQLRASELLRELDMLQDINNSTKAAATPTNAGCVQRWIDGFRQMLKAASSREVETGHDIGLSAAAETFPQHQRPEAHW